MNMNKGDLIAMVKGLKEDIPVHSFEYGYNKAIDTAASLIELYAK